MDYHWTALMLTTIGLAVPWLIGLTAFLTRISMKARELERICNRLAQSQENCFEKRLKIEGAIQDALSHLRENIGIISAQTKYIFETLKSKNGKGHQ